MREILFKAKRIDNGEWIIGSLIQNPYIGSMRSWISSEQDDKTRLMSISTYQAEWRAFEVKTDTICQYTGLTDMNGQKIYEGDVVKINDWIGKVIWNGSDTAYIVLPNDDIENETYCLGYWISEFCVEVIGNIFDNPELLNE